MAGVIRRSLEAERLGKGLVRGAWPALITALAALAFSATAQATQPYEGYEATVAEDSPVAQFRFNDAAESSEVKDSAGSFSATNHGIELNVSGPFSGSKAGHFESPDYAALPSDPLVGDSEFTAEAWVNWGGGSLLNEPIFSFGSSATNYMMLTPQSSATGHPLAFEIHPSSGSPVLVHTSARLTPNHWEYVAVSETTAGALRLYVNHELAASTEGATVSPASLGSSGLSEDTLGRSPLVGGSNFKGKLSNVAFYGDALSSKRIETHFEVTIPPENTALPTIEGLPKEGRLLTVSNGTWSGSPTTRFKYKWERCNPTCSGISGANKSSYRLTSADVGETVRASVTDETVTGSATAHSAQTATVTTGSPVNVKAPFYLGEAVQYHELIGNLGTWAGTATISYTRSWERCTGESCTAVSSSNSYTLGSEDIGKTIRFSVTATNGLGEVTVKTESSATVAAAHGSSAIAWGEDYYNNLGVREKASYEPLHVPVEGVETIRALTSGDNSGFALLENGTITSWGGDGAGQLGDHSEQQSYFKEVSHETVKTKNGAEELVPLEGVHSVSAANGHVIALLETGVVKAWGGNGYGEMGNGTGGFYYETKEPVNLARTITALTPEALAERGLPPVVAVEAMDGSSFAILENGEVMAWGDDQKGQLGIGSGEPETCHTELGWERCSKVPRLVRLESGEPLKEVTAITGSNGTGFALLKNAHVMAWGNNINGQVGRGVGLPTHAEGEGVINLPPTEVVRVNGEVLSGVTQLDSGGGHALALLENGEVVGWGQYEEHVLLEVANQECASSDKNELHEKQNEEKHEPNKKPCVKAATQIIAPGGIGVEKLPITKLSVGGKYNALLDEHGNLYTWGQDKDSQLGDGGSTTRTTPTKVSLPGPVKVITTSSTFMIVALESGSPIPPPVVKVTHGVKSFLLQWNFEAERLVYHVAHQGPLREVSEYEEIELEEAGIPRNVEAPEISGNAEEGIRLNASKGKWSGERPLTFKYQWQRCVYEEATEEESCVAVSNAERVEKESKEEGESGENLYKLTAVDVGHTLKVTVIAKDTEGEGSATSLPTEEVVGESESMNAVSMKVIGEHEEPITQLHEAALLELPYEMALTDTAGRHRIVRDKAL